MTDLKVRRTTITERSETEATVEIWISDAEDPSEATETISLTVKIEYRNNPQLQELQVIALDRARIAIGQEIQARPSAQYISP